MAYDLSILLLISYIHVLLLHILILIIFSSIYSLLYSFKVILLLSLRVCMLVIFSCSSSVPMWQVMLTRLWLDIGRLPSNAEAMMFSELVAHLNLMYLCINICPFLFLQTCDNARSAKLPQDCQNNTFCTFDQSLWPSRYTPTMT